MIHKSLVRYVNPHGKRSFILHQPDKCKVLDVGCGNNSSFLVKQLKPDCTYTGLDIGDYNQTKPNLADHYILTDPEHFTAEIAKFSEDFDVIISAHNLEHCQDRTGTLKAMISALKPGGALYMAFPSAHSVDLPSRPGTLNYYDDPTHTDRPPDVPKILSCLEMANMEIQFVDDPYRPLLPRLIGQLTEARSRRRQIRMQGTWAYYGFESVIWAKKKPSAPTPDTIH